MPANPEATFSAEVNIAKRNACAANHSCTHLIDQALREVLGTHVEQKGSLVTADSLRFDFSHFEKVTPEQLRQVEHLVNEKIRQNISDLFSLVGQENINKWSKEHETYGIDELVIAIETNGSGLHHRGDPIDRAQTLVDEHQGLSDIFFSVAKV